MGMRPPVMTYPLLGLIDLPPAVGVASFLIIGSLLILFGIFSKAALSYISNRFSPHWLLVSILSIRNKQASIICKSLAQIIIYTDSIKPYSLFRKIFSYEEWEPPGYSVNLPSTLG
jgi:hypothetical protein